MFYDFITKYTNIFGRKNDKASHIFSTKIYWRITDILKHLKLTKLTNYVVSFEQPGPGKQNSLCLRRMKAQIICCEMMERFIREITDQEVLPPSQIGYSERNEFAPSNGWKFWSLRQARQKVTTILHRQTRIHVSLSTNIWNFSVLVCCSSLSFQSCLNLSIIA